MDDMKNYKLKVLIVEDDAIDATFFENIVKAAGCTPVWAGSVEQGARILNEGGIDLVLSDLVMEGLGGMDMLRLVRRYHRDVEVIIITAFASVDGAVNAMKSGAVSYFVKGDPSEKLVADIKNVARRVADRAIRYESMLTPMDGVCLETIERRFKILLSQAQTFASGDWSMVLTGRPGSGRRTLSKFIHLNGPYPEKKYLALNAAEILGQVRSDDKRTPSGIPQALVNEVGEAGTVHILDADTLSPEELGFFPRLMLQIGGGLDGLFMGRVRFLFSTTLRSASEVLNVLAEGGLSPLVVTVPALHERVDDIPGMARRFAAMARGLGEGEIPLPQELEQRLSELVYVENLVSLKGLMEELVAVAKAGRPEMSDLESVELSRYAVERSAPIYPGDPENLRAARDECESAHIRMVLGRTGGNRGRAADSLGITSRQLYNKIVRYRLD